MGAAAVNCQTKIHLHVAIQPSPCRPDLPSTGTSFCAALNTLILLPLPFGMYMYLYCICLDIYSFRLKIRKPLAFSLTYPTKPTPLTFNTRLASCFLLLDSCFLLFASCSSHGANRFATRCPLRRTPSDLVELHFPQHV